MEFPGNSNADKEPKAKKPKLEKIVTGEVVKRKKPLGARFKEIFFGADFKSTARYLVADVVLPSIRNLVADAVNKGTDRVIFGASAPVRGRTPEYRPRVAYHNPEAMRDPRQSQQQPASRNQRVTVDDMIVQDRDEARMVIETLCSAIDQYGHASVADLYDLLGQTPEHIDYKWGWTTVIGFEIRSIREGYVIDLPTLEAL